MTVSSPSELIRALAADRSAIGGPEGNQAQHRVTRDPASHDEAIPRWTCGEP